MKLRDSNRSNFGWALGYCLAPLALIAASVLALSGCGLTKSRSPQVDLWQDMRHQEKFKPQEETSLFPDGRKSRRPPQGTIARGYLKADDVMVTGLVSPGMYTGKNPMSIDADLMQLGQKRFNVYCTPCHDRAGTGHGSVALKAPTFQPANLHDDKFKKYSDGQIFDVITNGKRTMPSYRYQIPSEHDRWAIVAYVRAVQRMSSGAIDDIPADMRTSLNDSKSITLLPPPPAPPVPPAADDPNAPAAAPPAPQAPAPQGGTAK